jgi:hypothetical protein
VTILRYEKRALASASLLTSGSTPIKLVTHKSENETAIAIYILTNIPPNKHMGIAGLDFIALYVKAINVLIFSFLLYI